jgi:hypothetical protein
MHQKHHSLQEGIVPVTTAWGRFLTLMVIKRCINKEDPIALCIINGIVWGKSARACVSIT